MRWRLYDQGAAHPPGDAIVPRVFFSMLRSPRPAPYRVARVAIIHWMKTASLLVSCNLQISRHPGTRCICSNYLEHLNSRPLYCLSKNKLLGAFSFLFRSIQLFATKQIIQHHSFIDIQTQKQTHSSFRSTSTWIIRARNPLDEENLGPKVAQAFWQQGWQ